MKNSITSILAREIIDSMGNPTVEAEVIIGKKFKGKASVPSGASTGLHEASELRDNDKKRYNGKGVLRAVKNVNITIAKKLIGKNFRSLNEIDGVLLALDGTKNKSRLGANAILSVSMASVRALANEKKLPLYAYLRKIFFGNIQTWNMPTCMMNIMNGGAHANVSTDFQEYMILPQFKSVSRQIQCGAEIFHALKYIIASKKLPTTVGDEGGFALRANNNEEPLKLISRAVVAAGYNLHLVKFGLDVASSEFYSNGKYILKTEGRKNTSEKMIAYYKNLIKNYPIVSIEDALAEDDWAGWHYLTKILGKKIHLIGDDLFATNIERLKKGIKKNIANAILVKINQIGTITETIKTILEAKKHSYATAISHRSGETTDDFISDLAIASGAEFIKTGSLCRGERIVKYNRLMEIEEEVKRKNSYG